MTRSTMRTTFLLILPIVFNSCCIGAGKCAQDSYSSRFRIVEGTTGHDLIFGMNNIYDKDQIKMYSLSGTDTIHHMCEPGPNPNPGEDSLLYADFDYRRFETVFISLKTAVVDTIDVRYPSVEVRCCPDYRTVELISYNNLPLHKVDGGIIVIEK
jgi:hypothetical protein